MLYAILIYGDETVVEGWSSHEEGAVMARHNALRDELAGKAMLGPAFRLMPTTSAVTVRSGREPVVIDGPFAETKEQLLGAYVLDCPSLDAAVAAAQGLAFDSAVIEIRPVRVYAPAQAGT